MSDNQTAHEGAALRGSIPSTWRPIVTAPELERVMVCGWNKATPSCQGYWWWGEDCVADGKGIEHPEALYWTPVSLPRFPSPPGSLPSEGSHRPTFYGHAWIGEFLASDLREIAQNLRDRADCLDLKAGLLSEQMALASTSEAEGEEEGWVDNGLKADAAAVRAGGRRAA